MSEDRAVDRLSVAEAAEALGVTRDAIHKRIKRGSIRHEKGEDGRFYVYVDASTEGLDSSVEASVDESNAQSKAEILERLIESQREQVDYLREQLAAEREANRENRRLLAAALERIPELETSREGRGSPTEGAEEPEREEPRPAAGGAQEGVRRPWWIRWLGR